MLGKELSRGQFGLMDENAEGLKCLWGGFQRNLGLPIKPRPFEPLSEISPFFFWRCLTVSGSLLVSNLYRTGKT
uniref:Uncharacterized protein n=1 Tax=Nelumbo nucifera TaxID=4432 RepID=A0A822YZA8_NELNU|nr:TPA_asm: hypothetical protein HUJ06_007442 [Nelumbo nucifera]